MSQADTAVEVTAPAEDSQVFSAAVIAGLLLKAFNIGADMDRPEVWDAVVDLGPQVEALLPEFDLAAPIIWQADLLRAIALATLGRFEEAESVLSPLLATRSQSPLVNGAMFRVKHMQSPNDPKFALENFICPSPFRQLDVLEGSSHLCCASWLQVNVGNLHTQSWQEVWNSPQAQAVRASMHDGTYRYCNKMACPLIGGGTLSPKQELADSDPWWKDVIEKKVTEVDRGPAVLNLAYDRTCNLSCPSCRQGIVFQSREERERTEEMQNRNILPMLADAENVFVTGSGDPFSSPTFRKLLKGFDPVKHPKLKVSLMTNGMLLTEKRWEEYSHLAGHVGNLRFSLDGATAATHELLRRGSRWDRVYENLQFCGRLFKRGDIDFLEIVFVVQVENFHEMGAFVDLAHEVGACRVLFARITNWGTFSPEEYARKAVFLPTHPQYADFIKAMQDPRLLDPIVMMGDLAGFLQRHNESDLVALSSATSSELFAAPIGAVVD